MFGVAVIFLGILWALCVAVSIGALLMSVKKH